MHSHTEAPKNSNHISVRVKEKSGLQKLQFKCVCNTHAHTDTDTHPTHAGTGAQTPHFAVILPKKGNNFL